MMLLLVASVCGMTSSPSHYRTRALAEDIAFELKTDRSTYVVGEPVEFKLTARNTSATPLRVHSLVEPLDPRLEIWSERSGSGHRIELREADLRLQMLVEVIQTLAPNQTVSARGTFSLDRGRKALILDQAGTYQFRAAYCELPGDPNSWLEANVWSVEVEPPPDSARDAFEAYEKVNAEFAEWPVQDFMTFSGDDVLAAFDFVERFPTSPWAEPVKKGLLSTESHRVPDRASAEETQRYRLFGEREQAARRHDP
jgi:hypothetical protein